MSVVGTIRKAQYNGVSYAIPADVDATIDLSRYATDSLATTGENVKQMVLKPQQITGITHRVDLKKYKQLIALRDGTAAVNATFELASGEKVIGEGDMIGDGSFTTAEGIFSGDFAFRKPPTLITN
ncbi:MAG TPA: hypothetical protein DDX98_02570 [Bacteroidales bacterium]|nr:hypothetical protein [Bacteroidales bacterium]